MVIRIITDGTASYYRPSEDGCFVVRDSSGNEIERGGALPAINQDADCELRILADDNRFTVRGHATITTPIPSNYCDAPPANRVLCYVSCASYTPSDQRPAGFITWAAALAPHDQYGRYTRWGGNYIGQGYAHARGHTGTGITVALIGHPVLNSWGGTFTGVWVTGYTADIVTDEDVTAYSVEGACVSVYFCRSSDIPIAAIIAGRDDSTGGSYRARGIAYEAKIKPIDVFTMDQDGVDDSELRLAIGQASTSDIDVVQNNWVVGTSSFYIDDDSNMRYYATVTDTDDVSAGEKAKWAEIVAGTRRIIVTPQGDFGHNSETGRIQLYSDQDLRNSVHFSNPNAYITSADIGDSAKINVGTAHARLPLIVPALQDKSLTVIALAQNDRIASFSNGCGDAKNYCLGAPGVSINSPNINGGLGTYSEYHSSTGLAAGHVTGAIAIIQEAFPMMENTEIVRLILDTADDLGIPGVDDIYGHGALNLARATEPIGPMTMMSFGNQRLEGGITIGNSGITLPTSFGESLTGFTAGFTDDYDRAFIGRPTRITQKSVAFTLADTIATWESPELQSITLDSNSKMQYSNYDASAGTKNTLMFIHNNANHMIGFSYNESKKSPDFRLTSEGEASTDLHFQKIRPIASDLMQVNSTYKLGKAWNVKNAITSGEFDTGNRFNEAMANLNYTGENHSLTIGAGTLKEYGQFLGASGTGAYQLSDATQSRVTHLAITQNLPRNSAIKLKYTGFKTEVDMRYNNFANINDLTADEYQLSFGKKQVWGKNDSLNIELIQPFAITDGNLQQSTVLGYNEAGDYNNVVQNYSLKPTNRRQQLRMTWQNQLNHKSKTKLFLSMQYDRHVNNLRDNQDSQILGGISTRF